MKFVFLFTLLYFIVNTFSRRTGGRGRARDKKKVKNLIKKVTKSNIFIPRNSTDFERYVDDSR